MSKQFEPTIIGFTCNWCSYRAADLAGTSRMKYAPNVRLVRVMCSGRLDPSFVLQALSHGADGVMITGCHPGDCHYLEQNYKWVRNHKWYELPRLVTVNDLYSFDPNQKVSIDPFVDIIGRQFKQPREGIGYDNSPVAHMWRTMMFPDRPL